MATHKSLKVTFWTRTVDLIKGILLYGSVNWRRASDGLQPPKLSPSERRLAMPAKNLEVIKPRHNPQPALVKTAPIKQVSKIKDVTAGAIVSDPLLDAEETSSMARRLPMAPSRTVETVSAEHEGGASSDDMVVVRRRRRHHRGGLLAKRAPRSVFQFGDPSKPGLFARLFGAK